MRRSRDISPETKSRNAFSWALCLYVFAVVAPNAFGQDKPQKISIEEKTKIHRLTNANRSAYDAFIYLNRIPETVEEDEEILDFTARVYSRLANQEGRILIKLPEGMGREAYLGYKTFLSTDAKMSNGNCVVCHAPEKFTDLKLHTLTVELTPPTPSLRNLAKRKVDIAKALKNKLSWQRCPMHQKNINTSCSTKTTLNTSKHSSSSSTTWTIKCLGE